MSTIMYKDVNVSQTLPLTLNGVLVTKHMLEHDIFFFFLLFLIICGCTFAFLVSHHAVLCTCG